MKLPVIFSILLGICLSISTPLYAGIAPARARASTPEASPFLGDKLNYAYHQANCPGYTKVPQENRVSFQSAQEAENAGFKRAKDCP